MISNRLWIRIYPEVINESELVRDVRSATFGRLMTCDKRGWRLEIATGSDLLQSDILRSERVALAKAREIWRVGLDHDVQALCARFKMQVVSGQRACDDEI